jgi:hypothetical protein
MIWRRKSVFCVGSPAQLLEKLDKIALEYNIDIKRKPWPMVPNSLTRRLKPILSNLREGLGINVIIDRITTTGNNKNKNTS